MALDKSINKQLARVVLQSKREETRVDSVHNPGVGCMSCAYVTT